VRVGVEVRVAVEVCVGVDEGAHAGVPAHKVVVSQVSLAVHGSPSSQAAPAVVGYSQPVAVHVPGPLWHTPGVVHCPFASHGSRTSRNTLSFVRLHTQTVGSGNPCGCTPCS
jgi:hypothetical protein